MRKGYTVVELSLVLGLIATAVLGCVVTYYGLRCAYRYANERGRSMPSAAWVYRDDHETLFVNSALVRRVKFDAGKDGVVTVVLPNPSAPATKEATK